MPVFRIQYASSLYVHLHHSWKQAQKLLKPGAAKHLALLGNIGAPESKKTKDFIRWCADNWEQVYCVPGAVELKDFYTLNGLYERIPKNVHLLDQFTVQVNSHFMIAGCPLWTAHGKLISEFANWNEREQALMAFKTPKELRYYHEEDKQFLEESLKTAEAQLPYKNLVFLTHQLPSSELLPSTQGSENTRKRLLYSGDIRALLQNTRVSGCLSGAGETTVSGFLGNKAYCGVNPAFKSQDLVPNARYRPDMVASFQHRSTLPKIPGLVNKFLSLPRPLVVVPT